MIKFINIRSGEVRTADTEPMIAAYYNSSDQSPNSYEGQDFGWRLAPETLKEMKRIRSDAGTMNQIAAQFQLPLDAISNTDILRWISQEDANKEGATVEQHETNLERQYQDEVRALDDGPRLPEPVLTEPAAPQKVAKSVKMEAPIKEGEQS